MARRANQRRDPGSSSQPFSAPAWRSSIARSSTSLSRRFKGNFQATVVDVQWVVESYGLFLGALILVGGSLGDLFGRRLIFMLGTAIFALASAGCGAASNIDLLIIARSIQGVGAALLVPGSLAIISSSFDEQSRGQAIGTWSGFTAITTAIGPVLGGWLVEHASWRWVFFINLPLAAAVIGISLWRVPESRTASAGRVDWAGAILATIGLGGLVTGFIESVNRGWRDPVVFGSLIAGTGFSCCLRVGRSQGPFADAPAGIVSIAQFQRRESSHIAPVCGIGIFFFLFPLNLIQVQKYSANGCWCRGPPPDFADVLSFPMVWRAGGALRPRGPLIIGPLIVALGFGLFAVPSVGASYWRDIVPGDDRSGLRNGGHGSSPYHLRHEFGE